MKAKRQIGASMQNDADEVRKDSDESLTSLDFLKRLRGDGPFLSDEDMHAFDRMKDYGREIELA